MKGQMKKDNRWVSVEACRTGRSVAEELRGEAVVTVVTSTTVSWSTVVKAKGAATFANVSSISSFTFANAALRIHSPHFS
jgi:hypothetical protein